MHLKNKIIFISLKSAIVLVFVFSVILSTLSFILLIADDKQTDTIEKKAKIAIVIDDFGRQRGGVDEMLALPYKITAAVMPFLEHTEDDAQNALEHGKEVIIHIPMQATYHDNPDYLGKRYIKPQNSEEEIKKFMEDAISDTPEAVGANIHMGTICSSLDSVMSPVIKVLKEHNMFFLDSKTSRKSVCKKVAEKEDIIFFENDVFLEHESKSKNYIRGRLDRAAQIAQKSGDCVVIGHVGNEGGKVTAEVIYEKAKEFEKKGIELVFLSELNN